MAEAITIHKSQGRSESKIVIDVRNPSKIKNHMDRQKWYVALSRARSLNGLYILGAFKPPNEINLTMTSSHIVTLQESWAIDNESYNIPDFEEISRNRLMGRPRAFGTINFCKLNIEARIV
ncbi:hypothetical protein PVAND_001831 [Polypedilum vanderplanki]|uniref:UvrD-like helicase C-terminal domain-containing protein n=1 Tax=Polypedilum vanderplanki TaxID=319348 RepID=A0A9J6BPK5_POLVA|nr:hypothetical protein PVAND_001831 [Polypedilum vanderplanki]